MSALLKFLARGTALVTDPHALERSPKPTRRFIGRRWQEVLTGRWGWVPTGKVEETPYHHDLVKACQDGDLWAADEETARLCKVGFDPTFGQEPTETIKDFKAKQAGATGEAKKTADKPADSAGRGG